MGCSLEQYYHIQVVELPLFAFDNDTLKVTRGSNRERERGGGGGELQIQQVFNQHNGRFPLG